MNTWQVGEFTITRIAEMPVAPGVLDGLIAQATPEVVRSIEWLYPDYATEDGQTLWDLHAYLLRRGDLTVMIDAGCGNHKSIPILPDWGGRDNPFLERLHDAGADPADVDYVVFTHMHVDHVGWSTVLRDGVWEPTFPNARYVFVRGEFEYQQELAAGESANPNADTAVVYAGADPDIHHQTRLVFSESLTPCMDAGLVDLVEADSQVVPGIRFISTPGHTRAHSSIVIESGDARAIVTGDLIHHPIQIARPAWSSQGDWNLEVSAANRADMLAEAVDTDLLILGSHFRGSSGGHVVSDGDTYRYVRAG